MSLIIALQPNCNLQLCSLSLLQVGSEFHFCQARRKYEAWKVRDLSNFLTARFFFHVRSFFIFVLLILPILEIFYFFSLKYFSFSNWIFSSFWLKFFDFSHVYRNALFDSGQVQIQDETSLKGFWASKCDVGNWNSLRILREFFGNSRGILWELMPFKFFVHSAFPVFPIRAKRFAILSVHSMVHLWCY